MRTRPEADHTPLSVRSMRVLIAIAEDKNVTVKERLDAVRQLSALKRVKPKQRKAASKPVSTVEAVLGTR